MTKKPTKKDSHEKNKVRPKMSHLKRKSKEETLVSWKDLQNEWPAAPSEACKCLDKFQTQPQRRIQQGDHSPLQGIFEDVFG